MQPVIITGLLYTHIYVVTRKEIELQKSGWRTLLWEVQKLSAPQPVAFCAAVRMKAAKLSACCEDSKLEGT